jgi:coenzyme F420-reducing hydrogenase beta subunit
MRTQGTLLVLLAAAGTAAGSVAKAITGPWPTAFPAKDLCSNCGLCKSSVGVASVTEACAFLGDGMSRAERLEPAIHGRGRRYDSDSLDEAHFGVHERIVLARGRRIADAQWTGVATGIATSWLASGKVDAVVVAASSGGSAFASPKPLLCRTEAEVLEGRRVKPSLCPSLEVLDEIQADPTIRRLLFCGVGCAVQALRSMGGASPESALGLEEGGLYVLGTHCVDNSPSPEAAQRFVAAIPGIGDAAANDVKAYEFMADFRVHARVQSPGKDEEVVKAACAAHPNLRPEPAVRSSIAHAVAYAHLAGT